MASQTKSRKIPTRNVLPLFFVLQGLVTLLGIIVLWPGSVMTFATIGTSVGPSILPSVPVQVRADLVLT